MLKRGSAYLGVIAMALSLLILPSRNTAAQQAGNDTLPAVPDHLLNAVQIERMLNRVRDLSSPAFTGRELGTRGNQKAATWLAYTLPKIGLEPLSSLGSFKHEFTVANYRIQDSSRNHLGIRQNSFSLHEDFVPAYFSASDSLAGQPRFVDPAWGDTTLRKLAGSTSHAIALVYNNGYAQQIDTYNQTQRLHSISKRLASTGFKAVLFIAPPKEQLPYSNTATNYRFEEYIDLPKDVARYMSNAPRPYVLPRATTIPVMLVSNETGRQLLSNLGLDPEVAELFGRLKDSPDNPEQQTRGTSGVNIELSVSIAKDNEKTAHNVIGILPGQEHSNLFSDPFVMVSSNFDQQGQHPEAGTPFYGANNNATGVASQLETAEILANAATKPPHTVVFAFFNGRTRENSGLRAFMRDSLVNIKNLTAGYNLLELAGGEQQDTSRVFVSPDELPGEAGSLFRGAASRLNLKLNSAGSFIDKLPGHYYNDATVQLLQKELTLPYFGISGGYYTYRNRTLDSSDKLNLSQFYDITRLILDITWKSAHYKTIK